MDNGFNNVNPAEQPIYTPPQQTAYTPPQQPVYIPPQQVSPKNRTAALILAITTGSIGINRFYLGLKGGVGRLIRYIISLNCIGIASACLGFVMVIAENMTYSYYYDDDAALIWMFIFLSTEIFFAFASIALNIPNVIGGIKDIVRTAKGQMTDGQGLPVTKW